MTVGSHDAAIRCVEFAPDVNVVVSGSWDSTVKLWDPRGPTAAGTFNQPDKVSVETSEPQAKCRHGTGSLQPVLH